MAMGMPSQGLKTPLAFNIQRDNVLGYKFSKSLHVRSLAYLLIIVIEL
jgi:hypothetical protein